MARAKMRGLSGILCDSGYSSLEPRQRRRKSWIQIYWFVFSQSWSLNLNSSSVQSWMRMQDEEAAKKSSQKFGILMVTVVPRKGGSRRRIRDHSTRSHWAQRTRGNVLIRRRWILLSILVHLLLVIRWRRRWWFVNPSTEITNKMFCAPERKLNTIVEQELIQSRPHLARLQWFKQNIDQSQARSQGNDKEQQ